MDRFHIEKNGVLYLDRLRIMQTPWFGVMLHRIHTPDLDRDPHDHPWPFASLILRGWYTEELWDTADIASGSRHRIRSRWSVKTIRLSQAHKIRAVGEGLLTLVITGRRQGSWRFWTETGPVDWRDYLHTGDVITDERLVP
jgi:hypothetical protein